MTAEPRVPPFRRDARVFAFVGAAALSQAGDVAWFVGLAWTAARVGGAAGAGLIMGVGSIPRALFVLLGGALADRFDARQTLIISNLARIGVLLVGLLLAATAGITVGLLVAITLVFGVFDAVYDPASGTLPRQLVRDDDVPRLMALYQLAGRLARLVGAPVGGVLVAVAGLPAVMVVDAASFGAIAVALVAAVRIRFPLPRAGGSSVRADLVDGFGYLRRAANARALTIAVCGLNLFVGPITAVGLALRIRAEGWGATSLGVLDACIGAAAAGGAVVALRWKPRAPARTGLIVLVAQAAACAAVGFAPYAGMVAAMLAVGLTAGLASAFLSGAFQRTIDPAYLGRAGSVVMLSDDALMPLAMLGFGALAASTSILLACVVTGCGFAALVLWSAFRPGIDTATPLPRSTTAVETIAGR